MINEKKLKIASFRSNSGTFPTLVDYSELIHYKTISLEYFDKI